MSFRPHPDRSSLPQAEFVKRFNEAVSPAAVTEPSSSTTVRPAPQYTFSATDIYPECIDLIGPERPFGPLVSHAASIWRETGINVPRLEYLAYDDEGEVHFTVSRRRGWKRVYLLDSLTVSRTIDVQELLDRMIDADMVPDGYLPELERRLRSL